MKRIFTPLLLFLIFLNLFNSYGQNSATQTPIGNCEKVQSLLSVLEEFRGAHINDDAYECRREYILDGFKEARVIVPGKEAKFWTVNMNTEEMQQIEAETFYLQLVKELLRCTYLNSWKAGETIVGEGIYHYNFKQTISKTGNYKSILISYYKLKTAELYKVEITLTN